MDKLFQKDQLKAYPIFQLIGGTEVQRAEFISRLQETLDSCHLDVGIVSKSMPYSYELASLARERDLVLVEGSVACNLHKIYIGQWHELTGDELNWPGGDFQTIEDFSEKLLEKLDIIRQQVPIWACILIGGRSSRMGEPKHLLKTIEGSDETWVERVVRLVEPLVDGVAVSGRGELPQSLNEMQRIPDIPGVAGPLTGVLSAMRWQPEVSWLVIACDMPFISSEAVNWLVAGRRLGCWGRVPRLVEADYCEPLFAWYDGKAAHLLEEQLLSGNLRIGNIATHLKIDTPRIPEALRSAWQNVNTPEQLRAVKQG
jgi:molybdopterin-guanine dinucleotide biosynthesis protein A